MEHRVETEHFVIIRRNDNRSEIYRKDDSGLEMFVGFAPRHVLVGEVAAKLRKLGICG